MRDIISNNWLDYHAYNWHENPHTVGAVAYFGPGQFSNLYSSLTRSNGKYIIIGEAASAHHAWIVGALESAVRGVYQFVYAHRADSAAASVAYDYEHDNIPGPFGPLPAEFSRPQNLSPARQEGKLEAQSMKAAPTGDLARFGVYLEQCRLSQRGGMVNATEISENVL